VEPIAVIGLAGRFPGAYDTDEYWANLRAGVESVRTVPHAELLAAGLPRALLDNPTYVAAHPKVPGSDEIDARFFGMTPREAELTDPQLRLFLEVCHSAVENAGYDPYAVPDTMGVYGALGTPTYRFDNLRDRYTPANQGLISIMNGADYLATQVSYKFNYTGPSMTVLTACSSSLTAVYLACQSLRLGDCDVALAGGASVDPEVRYGYWYVPGGVRSRDGHCRPFDVSAGGTVFGDGVGVVVLKRLVDAVADGDPVRAVIRGAGLNNDGSDKVGFGAPSVSGQVACIQDAMQAAGARHREIGYVEMHGTGTSLGDPIEVAALSAAWRGLADGELEPGSCLIGSVKSNIGHAVQGAGVAGLIKLILALENGEIPATVNFTAPNPKLELEKTPFAIADRRVPWERVAGAPRLGAISSLGAGGTNVHLIVGEGPVMVTPPAGRPRVVLWSALTEPAADAQRERLAGHFTGRGAETFEDSVSTLQRGRRAYPLRRAVVAADAGEAAQVLADPSGSRNLLTGAAPKSRPVTALLFPGQGSVYPRMGLGWYGRDPVFTRTADECLDAFSDAGERLRRLWFDATDVAELTPTDVAQPLLFTVEYALAQAWRAWAGEPGQVIGHSVGELVAATVAGVFDLPTAARLVLARGEAMQRMPAGAMAAVFATEAAVAERLPEGLDLAAVNGATETVVAGPRAELEAFLDGLRADGLRSRVLRTSHAFHSRAMAPAAEEFEAVLRGATAHAPALAMVSAATGRALTPADAVDPAFWAGQLIRPVRFADGVRALADAGVTAYFETGPGEALTALTKGATDGAVTVPVLPLPRGGRPDAEQRAGLRALASAWVAGVEVDWRAVDPAPARRTAVPGYAYQRLRFWVDEADGSAQITARAALGQSPAGDETGPQPVVVVPEPPAPVAETPFSTLTWVEQARPVVAADRGHLPAVVLVPDDRAAALTALSALHRAGMYVYAVRPGSEFAAHETEFRVRPGEAGDLRRVFETLRGRGVAAAWLVHAATLPGWEPVTAQTADRQLEDSFFGVLALVQQAARALAGQPMPGLLVLTSRSTDVSGGDPVDTVKATLHGQVRTLLLEEPQLSGAVVDVGPGVAEDDLADEVRTVLAGAAEEVVALRGARRWVRREVPFTPAGTGGTPVRRRGVYLITGGLGGLGLAVAGGLARTGLQPTVVLAGRHGLPEGDDLERALADGHPRVTRLHAAVEELEMLGAQVRVIACDVSDARGLRRALDVTAARCGPVNGVFHLAGLPGDGMLLLRDRQRCAEVLRPKVTGTLLLRELAATRPGCDFFVWFGSRAGVGGLVGSADYAAANAFMDAQAAAAEPGGPRQLSIDWPSWTTVGMAARSPSRPVAGSASGDRVWEAFLDAAGTWMLDEHRVNGTGVLPGTGHLDFVVRAYIDVFGMPADGLRLSEAVFRRPLTVPGSATLRVVFGPDGERWTFRTESEQDGVRQVHASGWIGPGGARRREVDLDALRARFVGAATEPATRTEARTFTLGPRWDNTESVSTVDGEKLFTLSLPTQFAGDLDVQPLHPSLLDAATAGARDPDEPPYLPFMYGELVLHERLPARLVAHVRRRPATDGVVADIDLIGPDGTVLAEISGYRMRSFDPAALTAPPPASAQPEAPAEDDALSHGSGLPAGIGIDPVAGVRMLFELLESRTPPQVVVRPFEGGRPTALTDAPVAAPAPRKPVAAAPARTPSAVDEKVVEEKTAEDDVVGQMTAIWANTLGAGGYGVDDDFFSIGGNSLSAIELMTNIRSRFGVELSIAALLDAPTITALADAIRRQRAR
jgi:phthiocerol/phenolphthiocerol synthesis type-I polyketide synthase E